MAIGLVIIGDEILSGKRADRHFPALVSMLKQRGMQLDRAEYLRDDPERITALFRRSFQTDDIVFSCGGIGATPDDHTRQSVAAALGVPLVLHPEAREKIRERIRDFAAERGRSLDYDAPDNLQRLKMGDFPEGAKIIPNPVNKIPGFAVATHYFVPGFPEMAHPMMEWVLDTWHQADFNQVNEAEKSIIVYGAAEAMMTPLMEEIERLYPHVRVFSLPRIASADSRACVEVGVKGEPAQIAAAFDSLQKGLRQINAGIIAGSEGNTA
jgi:molybdopterin-biosynthesis enzyme MoeA-like protein